MEKISPDSRTTSESSGSVSSGAREQGSTSVAGQAPPVPNQGSTAAGAAVSARSPEIDFTLGHLSIEESKSSEASAGEELEMMSSALPEAKIEAGTELIKSLESIPQKMAFKIGEAAEMVGVKQYVLRYWESEFDMLRPRKSKNNQRVYSRRDVETALMIKKLLYQDRFSIEGARTALRQLKGQVKEEKSIKAIAQSQETAVMKLQGLVSEIRRIREIFC